MRNFNKIISMAEIKRAAEVYENNNKIFVNYKDAAAELRKKFHTKISAATVKLNYETFLAADSKKEIIEMI